MLVDTAALRLVTEFPMSFVKYYLVRTHVTGGLMGFQYATILSFYRFVRIVRMYNGSAGATVATLNDARPGAATRPRANGHAGGRSDGGA